MEEIQVKGLKKSFQVASTDIKVLDELDFTAELHSITILLGRSGCGKTTLLRILGGMEQKDSGSIFIPAHVKTGMVFQEPRLMPWLTVWGNVVFGLKKREVQKEKVEKLIELTGLCGFEQAYPAQLSGGMQQRAALARTLAYEPALLLMDEPFAALDYFTRKTMQEALLSIFLQSGKGILFVTHSIDEALLLGNKIAVLEAGKIKKEYRMDRFSYPRDLLTPEMVAVKKEILKQL